MKKRSGIYLPMLFSAVMVVGMLCTAQLNQLATTSRHVSRVDANELARLLADSAARLKRVPAGTTRVAVEGAQLELRVDATGARTCEVLLAGARAQVARAR